MNAFIVINVISQTFDGIFHANELFLCLCLNFGIEQRESHHFTQVNQEMESSYITVSIYIAHIHKSPFNVKGAKLKSQKKLEKINKWFLCAYKFSFKRNSKANCCYALNSIWLGSFAFSPESCAVGWLEVSTSKLAVKLHFQSHSKHLFFCFFTFLAKLVPTRETYNDATTMLQ